MKNTIDCTMQSCRLPSLVETAVVEKSHGLNTVCKLLTKLQEALSPNIHNLATVLLK
jgi:hypothetical protein